VIGTRAASRRLFGVEPEKLDLARSAELLLAEGSFEKFAECSSPAQLKLLRDDVLARMAGFGGISQAEARAAAARPLACARRR
jgi:membrane peptidoglycan carboxypeptidase